MLFDGSLPYLWILPRFGGATISCHQAARNAAKAAGVPMKEIARVFALHNGSGQ